MVGGQPGSVIFSGLTQYPSNYQINVKVNPSTPTGNAIPIRLQMNGGPLTTNQLEIAVTNWLFTFIALPFIPPQRQ
jgi:uncharacterized protein (TIGR03437 family)